MRARGWGLGALGPKHRGAPGPGGPKVVVVIIVAWLALATLAYAQEPTPTPRPTATPMPTRTPVATIMPTPVFGSGGDDVSQNILNSLSAAIDTANTVKDSVGTSLFSKADEFGNDVCVAVGVMYAGQSILGSYLTTTLLSVAGAMLIISLARMGVWLVVTIVDLIKIW